MPLQTIAYYLENISKTNLQLQYLQDVLETITKQKTLKPSFYSLEKSSSSRKNSSSKIKGKPLLKTDQNASETSSVSRATEETFDIAQLMISSLHSWGLDSTMDEVCMERLGLLKPTKPISFGLLTRGGRLSLMLPGWYGEDTNEEVTPSQILPSLLANEIVEKRQTSSNVSEEKLCSHSRWQLSSALTTLHLVGLVSVANTLMSMNQVGYLVYLH